MIPQNCDESFENVADICDNFPSLGGKFVNKNYDESSDSKETDIESDFDDEIPDEKIFVPKLQLDRLLTARSIKSGILKSVLISIKDVNNLIYI